VGRALALERLPLHAGAVRFQSTGFAEHRKGGEVKRLRGYSDSGRTENVVSTSTCLYRPRDSIFTRTG
jgi:hypothetical protein